MLVLMCIIYVYIGYKLGFRKGIKWAEAQQDFKSHIIMPPCSDLDNLTYPRRTFEDPFKDIVNEGGESFISSKQ